MVIAPELLQQKLPHMGADELRQVVQSLFKTLTSNADEIRFKQATIDKLTHENAILKRLKFAAQSERFSAEQRSLLEDTLDADLQAVNDEIAQLQCDDTAPPKAKRAAAIMSLIQSAKLNGHDPYAYLKDVLTRLPTQRNVSVRATHLEAKLSSRDSVHDEDHAHHSERG